MPQAEAAVDDREKSDSHGRLPVPASIGYKEGVMLNYIWLGLIGVGVLVGGFTGRMKAVVDGAVEGAGAAVTLVLGLIGLMALWLGVMRLAEKAGLVAALARWLRPVLCWLFPEVPAGHPAMGSIVMNLAANMLGLTNAATPLGLRAMQDLETLNPKPGTATNAMCTFLAINTSSVQLIPMTAVAVLAAAGSRHPSAIIGTALLATCCSTAAGIVAVRTFARLPLFREERPGRGQAEAARPAPGAARPALAGEGQGPPARPLSAWHWCVLAAFLGAFVWFFLGLSLPAQFGLGAASPAAEGNVVVRAVNAISLLAIPFLVAFFPLYAAMRGIPVYEEFVEGAKEGFHVGVRIIPYLVAMLVAIGMFRGAGGLDLLARFSKPALDLLHFPAELLPMALVRPLTGSGSLAMFSDLVRQFGPDHLFARMAGTIFGSTETTFYVVVVYFGSVGIQRTRQAIPAGLVADAVGVVASVAVCRWIFG
jgi:spore maturation protein SpmA